MEKSRQRIHPHPDTVVLIPGCVAACILTCACYESHSRQPEGDPVPAVCGNGAVETGEECDDGNDVQWDGCDGDPGNEGIHAMAIDTDGISHSPEFQVNVYSILDQSNPSVAMSASGNFIVGWTAVTTTRTSGGSGGGSSERDGCP